MIGIYKITNLINGKLYIGQTVNFPKRKRNHLNYLRNNKHHNEHLQRSFNKYGEENFQIDFIYSCSVDELDSLECEYISRYESMVNQNGYNLLTGGQTYRTFSLEVRKKMSESRRNWTMTMRQCLNISKGRKGIKLSEESIERIKQTKQENKIQWGEDNPNAIISNLVAGLIIDDLVSNLPVKKIMAKFNVTQDVVYNLMYNKTYTTVKPEIREQLKSRAKNNQSSKNEKAISLYLNGYSQNHIAKELGISRNTLRRLLKDNNIDTKIHKNQYVNTEVNNQIAKG